MAIDLGRHPSVVLVEVTIDLSIVAAQGSAYPVLTTTLEMPKQHQAMLHLTPDLLVVLEETFVHLAVVLEEIAIDPALVVLPVPAPVQAQLVPKLAQISLVGLTVLVDLAIVLTIVLAPFAVVFVPEFAQVVTLPVELKPEIELVFVA